MNGNLPGTPIDIPNEDISAQPWHILSAEGVRHTLGVNTDGAYAGLSSDKVLKRQRTFGANALPEVPPRSTVAIAANQFANIIVVILLGAASVAFVLGDVVEGLAILCVIIINATIGFFMEWKAERTLEALKRQVVATTLVIRDGKEQQIAAAELVPGDLMLLSAGDRAPADGRIIETARLTVNEAAITGESVPVVKVSHSLSDPLASVGDRLNMVYMGTSITDGRGRAIVTAIGGSTEMGKIGTLLGTLSDERTPLEQKLRHLGNVLVFVVLGLCAIITMAGWYRGNSLLAMLEVGISLAIAAVPEGLPAVATMTLALGMQRMARMRTIIRRLPAVETLGSTSVICTDKTGTLTKNEMTVSALQIDNRRIDITGSGYVTKGSFLLNGQDVRPDTDCHLTFALQLGVLCNDAKLGEGLPEDQHLGDPTEIALLVAARKAGLILSELAHNYPRTGEIPFSSESKRMVTLHRTPQGAGLVAVKGAVSAVLSSSSAVLTAQGVLPLGDTRREQIIAWNRELASKALRVLALAYKDTQETPHDVEMDSGLTFVALIGMLDPLRDEAHEAVLKCREAGIRVIMITGDQLATASEIASQLGILHDAAGSSLRAVHGKDLPAEITPEFTDTLSDVGVFARVSPEHKLRIVEGLQACGHVVAMTGDGVNDAPALKRANIGIAMGIKGSEVAKDASDMVITDDNFATIVYAIEQGRIIYANIIRFVHYLFSCNLSEILLIFISIMIGWPLPLAAIQLLWLNMITDILPALALVLEPSTPGMMHRPPRQPDEPIISKSFAGLIILHATILSAATLTAFALGLGMEAPNSGGEHKVAMTMAFMTLALSQVLYAFCARSQNRSIIAHRAGTNYWLVVAAALSIGLQLVALYVPSLRIVLHTAALGPSELLIVATCSFLPVIVVETLKLAKTPLEYARRAVGIRRQS